MNISNSIIDFFQVCRDNFSIAFHWQVTAIPGSTNEKIYNECRQYCGSNSQISYTEVAEALRIQRQVKGSGEWKKGEWQLYSTQSQHQVSINAEGEAIIHCHDRGKKLGEGIAKTAYMALWLKSDGTVQPLAELVVKPAYIESVRTEDSLAKQANLSLVTTGSIKAFGYKDTREELSLLCPLAKCDLSEYAKKPIDSVTLIKKFKKMAASVNELHERGYIHCDIKPENFLEYEDEQIKLTDWGVVLTQEQATHMQGCLEVPPRCTKGYRAPEIVQPNYPSYSQASDTYALGQTCHKLFEKACAGVDGEVLEDKGFLALIEDDILEEMRATQPEARPTLQVVIKRLEALEKQLTTQISAQ